MTLGGSVGNAEDGAETRNRLLEAAIELYSQRGAATTSVQQVVDRADVTKGAFYHHFESKADLMHAVHDRLIGDSLEEVRSIVARGDDPRRTLEGVILAIFRNNVVHKAGVSLFVREYPQMPDRIMQKIAAQRDEYEGLVVSVIDAGLATGVFVSDVPSNVLAFGMIGMCAWSIHWFDEHGPLGVEAVGRGYASMIIDGLTAEVA